MAIPEIANLLASIKAAYDLAQSYNSRKVDKVTTEFLLEFTKVLLSVQSHTHSVFERCAELVKLEDELRKKIAEFDQWSQTETQYQLEEIHRGVFVYTPKGPLAQSQPKHWLCANCWQERKKSILQAEYHHESAAAYTCQRCKARIEMRFQPDSPVVVRRHDKFSGY